MTQRRLADIATICLLSIGIVACTSNDNSSDSPASVAQTPDSNSPTTNPGTAPVTAATRPTVSATEVVDLDEPIDLVARPGDDHLWVAERAGTVRRLSVSRKGRTLRPTGDPVLDITSQTTTDAERGLLSIAFSKNGDTLFVSHTDRQGDTRLVSYAIENDAVRADTRKVLLAVDQPYPNHNGGHVVLGPDGKLWFGLGDGGAANDPQARAQDPGTLLGKIIRLDPTGGDPEIVISGVRNPWRFSFDTDGSLWIGDVGQNRWEEVDHLPAGEIHGANLGWSALEGSHRNTEVDPAGRSGKDPIAPVLEYSHEGGNCSITGGLVYRGKEIPSLQGAYLFADYCAGNVRALRLGSDGKLAVEYDLGINVTSPVSFGTDARGEVYVLSSGGTIVRLVDAR